VTTGAFSPLPLRLGGSPQDGISPEQHARLCADLVSLKRVAPLAAWSCEVGAGTVTMTSYVGQNGSGLAYAPTATWNSTGDVSFVWPSLYFEDDYEIQYPFKVRAVIATAISTSGSCIVWEQIARGVRLRATTHGGVVANTNLSVTLW
jgi:hypothetical protein